MPSVSHHKVRTLYTLQPTTAHGASNDLSKVDQVALTICFGCTSKNEAATRLQSVVNKHKTIFVIEPYPYKGTNYNRTALWPMAENPRKEVNAPGAA
eukprot:746994-Prymnesium_polylepis.1